MPAVEVTGACFRGACGCPACHAEALCEGGCLSPGRFLHYGNQPSQFTGSIEKDDRTKSGTEMDLAKARRTQRGWNEDGRPFVVSNLAFLAAWRELRKDRIEPHLGRYRREARRTFKVSVAGGSRNNDMDDKVIALRSDIVTKPTLAMRRAACDRIEQGSWNPGRARLRDQTGCTV